MDSIIEHGLFRCTEAVIIKENVWIGLRCIICKGVTIGENSVIGAGSVVTKDIPPNSVAAGNPAKVVKTLNPNRRMLKRDYLFKNGAEYWVKQEEIDAFLTAGNSWNDWLRTVAAPTTDD